MPVLRWTNQGPAPHQPSGAMPREPSGAMPRG